MSDAQFLVLLAVILLAASIAGDDGEDLSMLAVIIASGLLGAAICVAWIL